MDPPPQGCVAFSGESIGYDDESRLQNSPYFCVFKYTRAVKQKVWNEAENRERDLAKDASHVRLLRHALPISLLILRKKPTVLQSMTKADHLHKVFELFSFYCLDVS